MTKFIVLTLIKKRAKNRVVKFVWVINLVGGPPHPSSPHCLITRYCYLLFMRPMFFRVSLALVFLNRDVSLALAGSNPFVGEHG
jgi:hypothetical protein